MKKAQLYLVFDVESIGLHGEGYAVGYVVVNNHGIELASGTMACSPEAASGHPDDREWVAKNCPAIPITHPSAQDVRNAFWNTWLFWKKEGAVLVADCQWPVEARFMADAVRDDAERTWHGPYPMHDVATARLCAGLDPLAKVERQDNEQPMHHPLADARQSARLWIEAITKEQPAP